MTAMLKRYATPLITGLFLVSLISGLALFFHVGPSGLHGMHEWLSLVLIVPFVLHLWRNWRAMTGYLRHGPMAVSMVLSVVAAGLFLVPTGSAPGQGNPAMALMGRVMAATPEELAPVLHVSPQAVTAALGQAGIAVAGSDQTVAEATRAAGKSTMDAAAALRGLGG